MYLFVEFIAVYPADLLVAAQQEGVELAASTLTCVCGAILCTASLQRGREVAVQPGGYQAQAVAQDVCIDDANHVTQRQRRHDPHLAQAAPGAVSSGDVGVCAVVEFEKRSLATLEEHALARVKRVRQKCARVRDAVLEIGRVLVVARQQRTHINLELRHLVKHAIGREVRSARTRLLECLRSYSDAVSTPR